jgi:hypothetical protein
VVGTRTAARQRSEHVTGRGHQETKGGFPAMGAAFRLLWLPRRRLIAEATGASLGTTMRLVLGDANANVQGSPRTRDAVTGSAGRGTGSGQRGPDDDERGFRIAQHHLGRNAHHAVAEPTQ